jgi:hypothetical protein
LKKLKLIFALIIFTCLTYSQQVYQHISNKNIYEFIDELANLHLVEVNSVIIPYARIDIAQKLVEVLKDTVNLNKRQWEEIEFYLRDYNKELFLSKDFKKRIDLFYYRDSNFALSANPILGYQVWANKNGTVYHRWSGAEIFGYLGKHWGFYASLRDNYESEHFADTAYLTPYAAGPYKGDEYSDMRGGITYSWKWGNIALVKDHIEWGNNYFGPNIISSKAPSFAMFRINIKPVKWFEFNYFHAWLVSEVVDSLRSYTYASANREVYHPKYMAANMFTLTPVKRLNISFGNSIIYSDVGIHPAYFMPVFFYKSADHTYNGVTNTAGQNAQMYLDVSSRQVRKFHFYGTWFLDALTIRRIFDKDLHSNHWSYKIGVRGSDLIENTVITLEYTRTNPLTYKNDLITTRYESNRYNLGHYLRNNADQICIDLQYYPLKNLIVDLNYTYSRKGPDIPYIREANIILGRSFMESVEWENSTLSLKANYQVINDCFLFLELIHSNIIGDVERYTPEFFRGKTTTFSFGINFGY